MAVNWGLAGQGFNPLEALQAYGQAHANTLQTRAIDTRKSALQQFGAGDTQGAQASALSAGDIDLYSKLGALNDEQRQQTAQHAKTLAGVAIGLSRVPAEQRAAAYASTIRPQLEAQGFRPEELDRADLSDAGLQGYVALGTDVNKALEALYKQQEPYTLAPGAQRMVGDKVVASNAPNDPETIRMLQAAGIDPQSPEGREAILGHVNPPQFMQFGSDATGRELIQTRGAVGGGATSGTPAGPAIETAMLNAIPGTTVTSRNRSPQHNAEVGGAPGSAHLSNDGRDFVPPQGVSMQQFEDVARRQFPHMYVLNEGDHVHVGLPKGQRSGGPTVVARTAPVTAAEDAANLDRGTIDYVAQQYARTGQLPPLGMGKQAAAMRQAIITRAAQLAGAAGTTGADAVLAHADFAANKGTLAAQSKMLGAVRTNEQTAERNMNLFMEASKKAPGQTDHPFLNRIIQAGAYQAGNKDVAAMNTAAEVFAQEYGKAISGSGNGSAALSDSAAAHARAVIDKAASPAQKLQAMQTLRNDMRNRISAFEKGIEGVRGQIRNGGASAAAPSGWSIRKLP